MDLMYVVPYSSKMGLCVAVACAFLLWFRFQKAFFVLVWLVSGWELGLACEWVGVGVGL